ncbi:MAG: hypothetical protein QF475_00670 [Candidatus Undinarchaeales archaeon]|jgi:hypothetical protein|nr:hypothetical protein [Candidatus Undinarchaeales archaeon]
MANVPTPKKTPQQAVSNLTWKVNNIETKVRINEQNVMNDRRHVQLLNKNVLDLKKEMRTKLDGILKERHDGTKKIEELTTRVENMERRVKKFVKRTEISAIKKFHENFNYFDNDMTKEEADKILDNIVNKSEPSIKQDG